MSAPDVAAHAHALFAIARHALAHGIAHGQPPAPVLPAEPALATPAACFVSLHVGDALRGCVGTTEADRPLATQVADYAFAAAFRDPRFPPLAARELAALTLEIHVLGPLEHLAFDTLAQLCARLRPGVDGLQLEHGLRRALFLPVMWDQLPTPEVFVDQLLRKGGIHATAGLSACRFTARVLAER